MDRKDVPSSTSSHPAWGTDTPGAPSAVLKCQSVREGAAGLPSQTACGSRSQGAGDAVFHPESGRIRHPPFSSVSSTAPRDRTVCASHQTDVQVSWVLTVVIMIWHPEEKALLPGPHRPPHCSSPPAHSQHRPRTGIRNAEPHCTLSPGVLATLRRLPVTAGAPSLPCDPPRQTLVPLCSCDNPASLQGGDSSCPKDTSLPPPAKT